ncbi:MAG: helicase, partial [Planctomycetota bacterium]
MATLTELLSKLSTDNHVKGSQFEHICKWYLEHDPKYKYELEKVWLWKDWPDRWGPDCGIDLVARAYGGNLWAIQAKAYNEQYAIKKADIDTFLSESSRSVFSFRLLITSTNLIGKTAHKTVEAQEKKVGLIMLSDLMRSEMDWPQTPEHLIAKPPARKTPRPHQTKAIEDVIKGFSKNSRGQLIMACGTGKTLVSLWVAEKLHSQRTLVLLPSLSLLAQSLREWVVNARHKFYYLPVCSDDTVRGDDHFISHTSEIGLPVTTDPDVVAEFLRRDENLIIFSTYQSSPVIAEVFARHDIPAFDLAIADEAHRCTGPISSNFATILDESSIKSKHRLFMTATPRYFTDKAHQEAGEQEYEIASMDDEATFGTIFHSLNFSDAIKQGLLSDYQVAIIGVDNFTYKKYAEQEKLITFNGKEATDAKTLASQIALCKAMRQYDLKRVISFHGRIKRAREFSEKFPSVVYWMPPELRPEGKIWSSYVSGEMTSGQRSLRIDRLRYIEENERGLISNARCLGEGVDVPALDGVAFIDPRHSQTDIIQAVGRAIRKSPDKKHGIIILPVFIENSEDSEFALEGSAFKPVWDVLKALRAHDDILAEELDSLCRKLGANQNPNMLSPAKISLNLPVSVSEDFAEAFRVMIVRKSTSSWEYGYGELLAYINAKGDSLVPMKYATVKGYKLGSWVASQRATHKKTALSKKRRIALEQLPEWVWDYSLSSWGKKLNCLKEYVKREQNADVPINYFTENGFNLGTWVRYQHLAHKRGSLSKQRQKRLEEIVGWVWKTEFQVFLKFPQILIQKLSQYTAMYGDSNVPINLITADNFTLGAWVLKIRRAYSQRRLPREDINAFENVFRWTWGPAQLSKDPEPFNGGSEKQSQDISTNSHESKWQINYKYLQKYTLEHETPFVPVNYITTDAIRLGSWVAAQRVAYNNNRLSKERQKLLEQLPGWAWSSQEQGWNTGYLSAQQYAKENGDLLIPFDYITKASFKLGSWVSTQRGQYKSDTLSRKRQKLLEQLPVWAWDGHGYKWQEEFEHLKEYAQKHGNCKV